MDGCQCKSLISMVMEFLNVWQFETGAEILLGDFVEKE
jgi:hypothetical protein